MDNIGEHHTIIQSIATGAEHLLIVNHSVREIDYWFRGDISFRIENPERILFDGVNLTVYVNKI
jgi:hypothetical protein